MTKQMLKLASVVAVFAGLATGCTVKEQMELPSSDLLPVKIDGSIEQIPTKATGEGFVEGDALGLYAVNWLSDNTVAGTLEDSGNQVDNAKYEFNGSNWNAVRPVYYKDVNTHADIYAYYPYQKAISSVSAYNFEVQQDQSKPASVGQLCGYEASDFLWCKVSDVTPSESKVKVRLAHKMAGVKVMLQAGSGFDEDEFDALGKSVLATGTTRKATIDFSTGTVMPVGVAQNTGIVMAVQEDDYFRCVVVPQTVAAGEKLFAISLNETSYNFSVASAVTYTAGKLTAFTITVDKKGDTGEYAFTLTDTQIEDWTEDRNTHGGEARQYYVVNVEEPGTLGDLIAAAGKNPAKIRNLKVTGQVNGADFYFMRDQMDILEAVNMKEAKVVAGQSESYNAWESIGPDNWKNEDNEIPDNAFNGKTSLCYFVFPEVVTKIGYQAFSYTNLSGNLVLPRDVTSIGQGAFYQTLIGGIEFPSKLEVIGISAFHGCKSLTGQIELPESLRRIEPDAFSNCGNLSGNLHFPDKLEYIGRLAFYCAGRFSGDLIIPEKITTLGDYVFFGSTFTGKLVLNNVINLEDDALYGCGLTGDLIIPEGVIDIPDYCFGDCNFSHIVFPSSLRRIGGKAFFSNRLEEIDLPEGLISIGIYAFQGNSTALSLSVPSSLQSIGSGAFNNCYYLSSIVSNASVPPTVGSGAFNGVAKDNFTVEVPEASVIRYQTENGWSDFRRIAGHQEFGISRKQARALNPSTSKTYTLRCPSGFDWSIESKPEWITVTPSSGTGKTDVTVTFAAMPRTDDTFVHEEGFYGMSGYKATTHKGRSGEVVFLLNDKDYRSTLSVEQFDYDNADGDVVTLQTATRGSGVNIVLLGDCYDARDIADGSYRTQLEEAYGHFFDLEPYATYKDYFNVYAVFAESDDSGIGTLNTVKDSKFGSYIGENRMVMPNTADIFTYALKTPVTATENLLVIMVDNTSMYEGVTYMYGDGSAIACCPHSTLEYPYNFRGIVQHEAGGHGFGKLADEYIYHNAFLSTCQCLDGCDHGDVFNQMKARGWYKNLSLSGDPNEVPWSHLIYHPKYSNVVDMYEGGYMHTRGVYRSEVTSCMNNNIPYYSSISRQAIVERIMAISGSTFDLADFIDNDKFTVGTKAAGPSWEWSNAPAHSENHGPVYMGEKPELNR